jgi:hypothetical protein
VKCYYSACIVELFEMKLLSLLHVICTIINLRSLLRKPRYRWKNNVEMHLKAIRCVGVHWIHPAQDSDKWPAVVNTLMKFRVQYNGTNFFTT